ncbi:hypothetical protein BLA24_31035 [Streptomyces cinnamoneus]|uniref:Microcystin degradation protein MlrC n=1 Tax=Streptomyces cinnamoneus TaxID=53446 RepID=A0A2G1X9N2_STRCJ|nr:M81 family metallopeptidase [Streptomyces cinnamoneus]PHQ47937.1 hypothetical protein BLA24_31035 [Streptomyces cinnamoneus]PPT15562.1 hypothetical protein CYQ11_24135 [Streptomyces cinnamoneus]
MRVVVAGIVHESSTYATEVTGRTGEESFAVFTGEALVEEFQDTATCAGGYIDACRRGGARLVPALHARAEPAGAVSPRAFEALCSRLLARIGDGPPADALLLDLHGAGVIAPDRSLDAELLRRVRNLVGRRPVLAVTMDLHANPPAEVFDLADVVAGFQEYPHVDMAERARRAADVALAALRGEAAPVTRHLRLPMLLPPSPTDAGAARELRDLARAMEDRPGVLACTVFHGFPYADTAHAGVGVVTVTDADAALADDVNRELAAWLWAERSRFLGRPTSVEEAVGAATPGAGRPLVIADAADNPGGGGCGDGTHLLAALLDTDVPACFATLHDPGAVAAAVRAGVGATVDVTLGGRHGERCGKPLPVRATVRALTDGRIVQQSVRRGKKASYGPCARLTAGSVDIVVASERLQVFDPEILLLHGIQPERHAIVAVKSAHHYRSGFAAVSDRLIAADAPGLTSRDVRTFPHRPPVDGFWPLDPHRGFPADAQARHHR